MSSTQLPAAVTYGTVTWSIDLAGPDTTADTDDRPDRVDPGATVTFTPSVPALLFPTAYKIIMPLAVPIHAPGGFYEVQLVATDNPKAQVVDWHWTVSVEVPGRPVWEFPMHVPADRRVDLSEVAGVAVEDAVVITRGPQGDPGPAGPPGQVPDTGWVDLTPTGPLWGEGTLVRVRRTGDQVFVQGRWKRPTGLGAGTALVEYPEGFRPAGYTGDYGIAHTPEWELVPIYYAWPDRLQPSVAGHTDLNLRFSHLTDDPFPTPEPTP